VILPRLRKLALASALAFLTAACGSGGGDDVASGGIGGTGISSGAISGFGSIIVNDVEIDLTGANVRIDDAPGCDPKDLCANPLKLGMVVNASVEYSDDGKSASAIDVEVEEALEGPVTFVSAPAADGTRTAVILGVTVIISVDDTIIDDALGLDFDNINVGDVLEVHGFFDENDLLDAKRVEKKAVGGVGSEVEIKGKIKQLSSAMPPGTFELRNLTVHFDGATTLDDIPGNMLADDLFVEVKGTLCDGTLCPIGDVDATKIEAKKLDDDIAKVSVEGIIASVDATDSRLFVLNTAVGPISVNATGATFDPIGLVPAPGLEVEVEGTVIGGTLVAVKVKIGIQIKIEATVQSKLGNGSNGKLTLLLNPIPAPGEMGPQVLTVEVNGSTQFQDKVGGATSPFDLDDITPLLDFLKIKARLGDSGLVATQIKRTNPGDVVLQGPADVPPTGNTSGTGGRLVSVLDIQFDTDADTGYEGIDGNPIMDPNYFFSNVYPGSLIKIKDKSLPPPDQGVGDGIADVVEFEN
jgi:hypothetical protein